MNGDRPRTFDSTMTRLSTFFSTRATLAPPLSAGVRSSYRQCARFVSCAALVLACYATTTGCSTQKTTEDAWTELRKDGPHSRREDRVAQWLLAEMLRPGGSANEAKKARERLDALESTGVLSDLSKAIYDGGHGKSESALRHFLSALQKARHWEDERASLFAWYAALRVQEMAPVDADFGKKYRTEIAEIIAEPGSIGFRAYGIVVDLWAEDAFSEAEQDVDEKLAKKVGCVDNVSLAGPFGSGTMSDVLRTFDPSRPGVWPVRFQKDEGQTRAPRKLETEVAGCDIVADEVTDPGVFYAQTFLELDDAQDLILSASGAHQLFINDVLVLDRDVRLWGIWPQFGAAVHLPVGRHRVVWKTNQESTALRVVSRDGKPAKLVTSEDEAPGYSLVPPTMLPDPNDLARYIKRDGVVDPPDELTRFIVAYLVDDEGESDVAAVLFEPLVKDPAEATGTALATAALFVARDPIYDETQSRDLVHELELRAAEADPGLWYPRFSNIVWDARQRGATTVVREFEALVKEFPEVARIHFTLAELYEELDWGAEYERAVLDLIARFPNDTDAIKLAIDYYENEGQNAKVDELLNRLLELDPDTELLVTRALNQQRYEDALHELRRLAARRPSRKDIPARIERLLVSAGNRQHVFELLKQAVKDEPRDAHSWLALADAKLAKGEKDPLGAALVEAIEAGADPSPIAGAIDLVEGVTALEPYRIDGKKVIAEYEAQGKHLPGTAARVLDYGAVWVNSDGSSRFLEHEIVVVQSEEGIKRFAEAPTHGLILAMRVIKKDGTVLEPEAVAEKRTATMPHLEIGDYVETERVISRWGGGLGQPYVGPGWYFRETDVAYARSEFVVIAPADKKLILETHNQVPKPEIEYSGSMIVYRYRVDESPAAPVEPMSPPAQEFLPSVAIGWDVDFETRLREASRTMIPLSSNDPRIVRIAKKITAKYRDQEDKVRALYHWVLDSVQDGEEDDGRRVVVSRNGNRWRGFETLCRALGIPVRWALAESRLASPVVGAIGSAERPLAPLLVVGRSKKQVWLTIDDKFAPFGTVPSHLRGEKAYLLGELEPVPTRVPQAGAVDGITYEGKGVLSATGSAELDLNIVFRGTYATSLRNGLSQIPGNQLGNVIESNFLGQNLQGARLLSFRVQNENELDKPLIINVKTAVPRFATPSSSGLLLSPPFMPHLSQLTTLAERVTPLLIAQESSQSLNLVLELPEKMSAQVRTQRGQSEQSSFVIADKLHQGRLHLVREVTTRAGRVQVKDYPAFQKYTNEADAALGAALRVTP